MTLKSIFILITLFCAVLVILPALGISEIISEPLEQLRVYSVIVTSLIVLLCLLQKFWLISGVNIAMIAAHLYVVTQAYAPSRGISACDRQVGNITIMAYNIFYKNQNTDAIVANILASDADIVALQEGKKPFLEDAHDKLSKRYPFAYPDISKGEFFSPAIFSKYPIISVEKPKMPISGKRVLQVQIDGAGTTLEVISVHAVSPKNLETIKIRNMFFQDLANHAQNLRYGGKKFVIAGDFNSVPWHPNMISIQKQGALTGNTSLWNYFGTWPNWGAPFLSVPIDHIFTSEGLKKTSYQKVNQSAGSDHFPVISSFDLCK